MGSSKSAQALITKFNYEELGMTVWLIKPSIDTRDGADLIRSRIGLEARAQVITPEQSIIEATMSSLRMKRSFSPQGRSTICARWWTKRICRFSASVSGPTF